MSAHSPVVNLEAFEQLQRVLNSETFRAAPGLRALLAYLGEKSLAGEAESLKEYTVGVEAFGKPADYTPQLDASVRVQAGKLRLKLEEYYRGEGAGDPIVIEFPKGHFHLKFHAQSGRIETPSEDSEPVAPAVVPRPAGRSFGAVNWVLVGLVMVLGSLAALWRFELWDQQVHRVLEAPRQWNPALEALWQPFLASDRPVVVSYTTPLFFRIEHYYIRDTQINDWDALRASPFVKFLEKHLDDPAVSPVYAHVGAGEVNAVFLLSRLLATRRQDVNLKRNPSLSWEDIKTSNVIFLGDHKFNTQLKALPLERHFVMERFSIRNLHPLPGEPAEYRKVQEPDTRRSVEGFALISRLSRHADKAHVLVFASNSTQGTWAAVEAMAQPAYAEQLVARLRDSAGRIPDSFQVLVRARFETGVPIHLSYVTHRVLSDSDDGWGLPEAPASVGLKPPTQ